MMQMRASSPFLIHVASLCLLFHSGIVLHSSLEYIIISSNLSLGDAFSNAGLALYPLGKLELDVERQNEFIHNFDRIQREEKELEDLMVLAELRRLNGRLSDYEETLRVIERAARESNDYLSDIMEGFPLKEQARVALIIVMKNVLHHGLLGAYHLGYILGGLGVPRLRLGSILIQGLVGLSACVHISWDTRSWALYFLYLMAQMLLAIEDLRWSGGKRWGKLEVNRLDGKGEAIFLERHKTTLCRHASLYGLKNIMRTILRAGFEDISELLNSKNEWGLSCIHLVAMEGHSEIFQQWMNHKTCSAVLDLSALTSKGNSALFLAIQQERSSIAKKFILRGVKPSLADIALAFRNGQYEVFNILYAQESPLPIKDCPYLDAYICRFNALLAKAHSSGRDRCNLDYYIQRINSAFVTEPQSPNTLIEFFECPICFEEMRGRIMACVHDHWLCVRCFASMDSCPICRLSFNHRHNYYRAINAEKIAEIVFKR